MSSDTISSFIFIKVVPSIAGTHGTYDHEKSILL